MKKVRFTIVLALALPGLSGSESWAMMHVDATTLTDGDFTYLGSPSKWEPGANTATFHGSSPPAGPMTPGGATFSIMGSGFTADFGYGGVHTGTTAAITALGVPGYVVADYATDISAALDVWAAVSGFTNLGQQVSDGGVNAAATEASGGHLGDIRVAAWEFTAATVLAHTYQPGTESIFGNGGTIAGDMHFDVARTWVDNAADVSGNGQYDFYTVALHELGHSLGLGHSDPGTVMSGFGYAGALRTLTTDDIAGIQAIYGVPVPGALLLGILGMSVAGIKLRRSA